MTPRTGVYPFDIDLLDLFHELFYSLSNRELLHALLNEPFHAIRKEIAEGTKPKFVLMEMHRKWTENIEEHLGVWAPLPSWDLLCASDEWCEESGMDEAFYMDSPEWTIFGDDIDIAYTLIDKLPYTVWMDDNLERVVGMMLEIKPDISEMLVHARDLDAIYVIRSPSVQPCGIQVEELTTADLHAFSNLGSGVEAGKYPTYVLSDDIVTAYAKEQREQEEWLKQSQQRSHAWPT